MVAAAESVIGSLDSDYKRDEYVEQVTDDTMIRNLWDEQMAFFSPAEAMEYLESLEAGSHQAENDVYHLSKLLAHRYTDKVDIEEVNAVHARFSFKPL